MATCRGRCRLLGLLSCLAVVAPSGCAQSGPLASRNTTLGSLKASVSQLEFDNDKLRREVGELKAENVRLDTQLAQERDANGEVTARLDDAKDLLRRQGGDVQSLGTRPRPAADDEIPPPVRRTKGGRTPPPAQIRRPEIAPFDTPDDRPFGSTSAVRPRDLGPADQPEDDDRWLPVARGMGKAVRR